MQVSDRYCFLHTKILDEKDGSRLTLIVVLHRENHPSLSVQLKNKKSKGCEKKVTEEKAIRNVAAIFSVGLCTPSR